MSSDGDNASSLLDGVEDEQREKIREHLRLLLRRLCAHRSRKRKVLPPGSR